MLDSVPMTRDGYNKIKAEIQRLENEELPLIVEKIAEGKVNAFYAEKVLTEQLHVKSDDYGKTKVGDVLKQAGVNAVTDFEIMKVGG